MSPGVPRFGPSMAKKNERARPLLDVVHSNAVCIGKLVAHLIRFYSHFLFVVGRPVRL